MDSRYNIIWDSPSKDPSGSMPIGNGDIGAGVYAIEGGALYLLLSKTDSINYKGELLKTGRLKIDVKGLRFDRQSFKQTLDIEKACIIIECQNVKIKIWTPTGFNVYHIEIVADKEIECKIAPEFWQRLDGGKDKNIEDNNALCWLYNVGEKSNFINEQKAYGLENTALIKDPYINNIFGHLVYVTGGQKTENTLTASGKCIKIDIYSLSMQTKEEVWIDKIREMPSQYKKANITSASHEQHWKNFWEKSYIHLTDNRLTIKEGLTGACENGKRVEKDKALMVGQSYMVNRFLMACQSMGKYMTKFNGGIFTLQLMTDNISKRKGAVKCDNGLYLTHEDDRRWGERFTFQNQRLLYWPMLMSGDYDLMAPFFNHYINALPIRREMCKYWFGHEGAFYRENVQISGAELQVYEDGRDAYPPKTKINQKYEGWYHDYYFTSGLEIATMMIEYVKHTQDNAFAKELVKLAKAVVEFYKNHYTKDVSGKLLLAPAQVLETYWIATNPSSDIGGLRYVVGAIIDMNLLDQKDEEKWRSFYQELPQLPMRNFLGKKSIRPAEKYKKCKNIENGELYPVFPFSLYGVFNGKQKIVLNTMKKRTIKDATNGCCWTQDQIDWAYAGEKDKAATGLINRFSLASKDCRFHLFGDVCNDEIPDFDHFGAGAIALQRMLVQEDDQNIVLLPAFPDEWDAEFKLWLRGGLIISGEVNKGKLNYKLNKQTDKKIYMRRIDN